MDNQGLTKYGKYEKQDNPLDKSFPLSPSDKRMEELLGISEDILEEMKQMNKHLAIIGSVMVKYVEPKSIKGKKAKD